MQRLPVLFQRDLVSHMLPVWWQSVDLSVHGAISQPTAHRGTRQRQYFWVNGRPIRSTLLSAALGRAYGALLPPGRYPLAALGLTLPAPFLDVNVHPRKQEVTFIHERAVFAAVQEAVQMALQGQDSPAPSWDPELPSEALSWPDAACIIAESGAPFGPAPDAPQASSWHYMGQIGHTFLVAGGAQGLALLDQHAAHESLLYAQLMAGRGEAHELPDPVVLTLSADQARWLTVVQAALSDLGCRLDPFGHQTVLVRAVPAVLSSLLRPGLFLEALDEARQRLPRQALPEAVREQLAAALSCRTAIRAGDTLEAAQVAALVDAFGQQRLPYTCPHDRPTYVTMTLSDLERRFLRLFPLDTSSGG
jgi:DNA mismatch repair protein MutL